MAAAKKQVGDIKRAQDAIRAIRTIVPLAAGALVVVQRAWNELDRDHQVSGRVKHFLQSLTEAAKAKDPAVRLRRSLVSISDHVNGRHGMPPEQASDLRVRVRQCNALLDVADSLVGADRRKVIKKVKAQVSTMVVEILSASTVDGSQAPETQSV